MKSLGKLFCLGACLAMATSANASDMNLGSYARSAAMGGAGIALADNAGASIINPAANAAMGAKFGFIWPSLDLNSRGATISELQNRTSEVSNTSGEDAIKLAEDFGKQRTSLNLGMATGITGTLGITAEGEAQGLINPGTDFQAWVNAGHPTTAAGLVSNNLVSASDLIAAGNDPATIVSNYASDLTNGTYVKGTYVYSLPAITYGTGLNAAGGKLWVGTKMRWMRSDVRNWNITASGLGNNLELAATETARQKDNGFGADLGFIFQPNKSRMQFGAVINNFVEPNLSGVRAPSMVSLGTAIQYSRNMLFAADLVNINKAYDENTILRMGAEYRLNKKMIFRAGYSGSDFTYGFGLMGINVAFATESPAMISRTLRF